MIHIIITGLITGFFSRFLAIVTNTYAANYIKNKKLNDALSIISGNTLIQSINITIAIYGLYIIKSLTKYHTLISILSALFILFFAYKLYNIKPQKNAEK